MPEVQNGNGSKVTVNRAQIAIVMALVAGIAGSVWFVADKLLDRLDSRYEETQQRCEERNGALLSLYQSCLDKSLELVRDRTRNALPTQVPATDQAPDLDLLRRLLGLREGSDVR